MTIAIMSLIFVNLIFLPSIVEGIAETIEQQTRDHIYGNILIEPKEDDFYIDNVDSLQKKDKLSARCSWNCVTLYGWCNFYS